MIDASRPWRGGDLEFFDRLIGAQADAAALKVALAVFRLAASRPSGMVSIEELLEPRLASRIAGKNSPEPVEHRVRAAVSRALADGLLLQLSVRRSGVTRAELLAATDDAQDRIDRLRAGDIPAFKELELDGADDVTIHRPNIFALYERHIGPLTPLVSERLRDAERSYPRAWIEEAMEQASRYNRHNWRYVQTILSRWEEVGAPVSGSDRSRGSPRE